MKWVRYYGTAALLGIAWFGALLIPPWTREFLLANVGVNMMCMLIASCIVAWLLGGYIASARTRRQHLLRAIALPYVGAAFFLVAFSFAMGGLMEMPFYLWGMIYALLAAPVVVPFGAVCQALMWRAASRP